jgi:hypothetical protein
MWFIIRSAFCVGLVYSIATGEQGIGDVRDSASATLSSLAGPGERALLGSAIAVCENDTKFCLDAARRLAGAADFAGKPGLQDQPSLVSDTLTPADRLPPWRGAAKPRRPLGRGRVEARATSTL